MIDALDNALMVTDLDANNFRILNLFHIAPVPPGLVASDDPRLTDARPPLDASVTDSSVAAGAGIDQSKLSLDGDIPPTWLGLDNTHAAPGNLVEYTANKGIPGGYAGLDGTGKVPAAQLPAAVGVGTVTSVALAMPAAFTVSGSPVTTSGTLTADWANVPDGTWFGNNSGGSAVPTFNTSAITVAMVPPLPASQITTGTFSPSVLPVAIGVGPTSSTGIIPDPGAVGNITDYLARDMTYKPVPSIGPAYQPKVASPILATSSLGPSFSVSVTSQLAGSSMFYIVVGVMATYAELTTPTVTITSGQTLQVYGAKAGYTNSDIASYTAP